MEKASQSLTIKLAHNRGFGMVELLLALMIIGIISIISIPLSTTFKYTTYHSDLLIAYQIDQTQLHAIAYIKKSKLPFLVDYTQLYYNAQGNINQAKKGRLSYPYNSSATFFLGYGRYEIH